MWMKEKYEIKHPNQIMYIIIHRYQFSYSMTWMYCICKNTFLKSAEKQHVVNLRYASTWWMSFHFANLMHILL